MNRIITRALHVVELSAMLCMAASLHAGQSDVRPGLTKQQLAQWQIASKEKDKVITNFFTSCRDMLEVKNSVVEARPHEQAMKEAPLVACATELEKILKDVEGQAEQVLVRDAFTRLTSRLYDIAQETDRKFQEFINSLDQDECSEQVASFIKVDNEKHWNFVTSANQPEAYVMRQLIIDLSRKTQLLALGRCAAVYMKAIENIKAHEKSLDAPSQAITRIVDSHFDALRRSIQAATTQHNKIDQLLLDLRTFVRQCEGLHLAQGVNPVADTDIVQLREQATKVNDTCELIPQGTRKLIAQTIAKIDELHKSKGLCGDAIRRIVADTLAEQVKDIEQISYTYEGFVKKFNNYMQVLNANKAACEEAQNINVEFHKLFSSGEHDQFGMEIAVLIDKAEKLAQQHNIKLTAARTSQPEKPQQKSTTSHEKNRNQTLAQQIMSAAKKNALWLGLFGAGALAIGVGYKWYCSEFDDEQDGKDACVSVTTAHH